MKHTHWKWSLPAVQLALAMACHIYEPHEYRAKADRDPAFGTMQYAFQNSPAMSGRISKGINFPALTLDYPLRDEGVAVYEHNSDYNVVRIAPKDIGFFFGIVVFWHWVGRNLDRSRGRRPTHGWPRPAAIGGLICGVVFGGLTGAYAVHLMASKWRPERHIGAFGIIWSIALLIYFGWRLAQRTADSSTTSAIGR